MSGFPPSPDLFLARRAAAGNDEAWDQLVERHGRRLYNLAFQFAGNREDAEDLTQDIFIRLYQNLRSYRGDAPIISWALRLSRNLCIDHYRRSRRERGWTSLTEVLLDTLPAPGDPQAEAERRQHLEAVYESLADLPEDLSEVVLLCDLQGCSLDEVAAYLAIPMGTLKSRLHRGRERLKAAVRERLSSLQIREAQDTAERSGPC